ncbi:MAG: hypothetical protein H0U27_02530, partial [Nitrosopumilus sp.]|nr:hypothetical protein [Nitrosopumilus sp.]
PNVIKWSKKIIQEQEQDDDSQQLNFTFPDNKTKDGKKKWKKFNKSLDQNIQHLLDTNNIDEQINELHTEIINAAKINFKYKIRKKKKGFIWKKDEEEKKLKKKRQWLLKLQIKLHNGDNNIKELIMEKLGASSEEQAIKAIKKSINKIGKLIKNNQRRIIYNLFKEEKQKKNSLLKQKHETISQIN